MRRAILARLQEARNALSRQPDVTVEAGIVRVAGNVHSSSERDAIRMIVEGVAGPGFRDEMTIENGDR